MRFALIINGMTVAALSVIGFNKTELFTLILTRLYTRAHHTHTHTHTHAHIHLCTYVLTHALTYFMTTLSIPSSENYERSPK